MKSSNLTQLTSSENQPQSSQLKSKTEYSFHPPYQIEFSNEINQDKSSIGKNGEQSHIDSNSDKGRNIDEFIRRISSVERHIKKIMVFKNLEKNFRDIMETCKVMVTQRNIQEFLNLYSQTLRDHQDWIVKNTLRTSQSELESQKSLNASNTQIINETAPKTSKSKNEKLTENSNLSRLSSNQSLESIPATSIDVISLLISWFKFSKPNIEPILPHDFKLKLISTLNEYENMHDEIAKTGGDTSSIDIILKKFEKHLKLANKNEKYASANSFEERCRHGLHEIFGFYCKQLRLLGNTPTFESIERNNETLNLGKFFKFLRDFDIMDTQRRPDKKVLTRKLVQKLYLKITDFRDEMDENQFLKTIELISEFYYDVEYDNINGTNHKSLAPNEKLLKFYMDIGCHDPNIYLKNCKGVIHSFGVAPSRIPIDDLSRNYKFKPEKYKMQRKSVEEWKRSRGSSLEKNSRNKSKSSLSSQSGQPITNTEQLSLTPASLYNNSNPLYKSNEQKPSFTLQSLNDMTPEALISKYDGWDLKELINEDISEDGILEKNYPLSELRSPANSRPKLLPKNLSARNFTYKEKFAKNTRNLTEEILKRANELSKLDKMSEKRRFDNLGGLSDDKNKKYLNRNI